MSNVEPKTQALLAEFRKLDADKSPNTVAIVTRVILEFVIEQFVKKKKLPQGTNLR